MSSSNCAYNFLGLKSDDQDQEKKKGKTKKKMTTIYILIAILLIVLIFFFLSMGKRSNASTKMAGLYGLKGLSA